MIAWITGLSTCSNGTEVTQVQTQYSPGDYLLLLRVGVLPYRGKAGEKHTAFFELGDSYDENHTSHIATD